MHPPNRHPSTRSRHKPGVRRIVGAMLILAFLVLGSGWLLLGNKGAPLESPGQMAEPPSQPPATASPPATLPPTTAPDSASAAAPRASRSFFGPHSYPPEAFAAYGIVAFPARAVTATRERYVLACEAYVATLPTPGELTVARSAQMVTVWPVDEEAIAAELTERRDDGVCGEAVDRYHLPTALEAMNQAAERRDLGNGDGPFLLAWAPARSKGQPDAPILIADLSTANSQADFMDRFRRWRSDIESKPELWRDGWSVESLRLVVRAWADRYGPAVLRFWES